MAKTRVSMGMRAHQQARTSSARARFRGSHRYSVMRSTRMQPMVRTANARMRGLGWFVSCTHKSTDKQHLAPPAPRKQVNVEGKQWAPDRGVLE